ncbi:MAG: hypothetical protein WA709_06840 [Stellaceae bacterium]
MTLVLGNSEANELAGPKERSARLRLFAVASLLLRCSLAVILPFMPPPGQGFRRKSEIDG